MAIFKQGDRVAYSRGFVKGFLGATDGKDIADRRGTVEKLTYPVRGASGDKAFYRVVWDDSPNEGSIILSTNIVRVDKLHTEQV
mgnify:CR=1 FL=1